ncbi:MAG TPA: NAD(P)-dependent oxidoreductase [Steroidobacteraceae bacterium]
MAPIPTILVASRFLLSRREAWDDGWGILGPDDIDAGLSAEAAARIEVIVSDGERLDRKLVEAIPNLKLVACFSTGYAGIDLQHLRSRRIAVTTAGGVNAHDVADHAMALLLAWWHRIPAADRNVRAGTWRDQLTPRPSLRGKRLGIVGLGRVGLQIARRAEALELTVTWWGPHEKPGTHYARAESPVTLAAVSDILIVAARATPANAGTINTEVMQALGPKGLLINVSRGFLVDEAALVGALRLGTIGGAALDVFAHEPTQAALWSRFENVVLSPHIAGYTEEAGIAMFGQLRENIRRHFAGAPLLSPVEDKV